MPGTRKGEQGVGRNLGHDVVAEEPSRKRWDRLPEQPGPQGSIGKLQPPFPGIISDVIWIVSRLDGERIKPFMPPSLTPTAEMVGVLGIYDAPSGSAITPYVRLFGGVAVQGHQAPDSRDALYIVGDLVTPNALGAWRDHYVDSCLSGEPRMWWEGESLHGAIESGGKEWLHVVVRPSGA